MDRFLLERQHEEQPQSPRDRRHPTERDRDRILHSAAFRRLQGKTQVLGIGHADFYRTRLTHSIEASQLARAIANNLIVDETQLSRSTTPEAVEAAALAHDLGHPPFGHAGERTLDGCMQEFSRKIGMSGSQTLRFEGNAQTFHILVSAEPKSPSYPGLNLTRATLAAVMKYPYEQDLEHDKFIFASDRESARWTIQDGAELLTTTKSNQGIRPRVSINCQILDWADDCAYSVHDVEDALQGHFLEAGTLQEPSFVDRIAGRYGTTQEAERAPTLSDADVQAHLRSLAERIRQPGLGDDHARQKTAMRDILDELVTAVSLRPIDRSLRADYAWQLVVPEEARILATLYKSIAWEAMITHPRVTAMTARGKEILRDLFHLLMVELVERENQEVIPRYYWPLIRDYLGKGETEAARGICNFLALLTDMDAVRLHNQLRGLDSPSLFDSL